MFDIITMGSATIDAFAYTESSEMFSLQDAHSKKDFIAYPLGQKILVENVEFHVGGGGTNTAVSFARLGLNTAFLGKIGVDQNGQQVLDLLKKENIDFIGAKSGKTGYSVILDSFEHDRTILAFKGANNIFMQSEVVLANLKTKWFYTSSMIGQSFDTLVSVVDVLKRTGAKIAFNPSNYQAKLGLAKLGNLLKKVDVLILNKEEAQLLLGVSEQNKEKLVLSLGKLGPSYAAITDGKEGVVCYNAGKIITIGTTPNLKVVEATGAGDAFASAFVAGIIYNLNTLDAIKLGICQSESTIIAPGAKNNLLSKDELFEKMKNFTGKVDEKIIDIQGTDLPKFYIAEEGKEFVLHNGEKVHELKDLALKLKTMSDDVFKHHTEYENHFADWIKNVFEMEKLSNDLKKMKTKNEMSDLILKNL